MSIREMITMWIDENIKIEPMEDELKWELVSDVLNKRNSYILDRIDDIQFEIAKDLIEDEVMDVLDEVIADYMSEYAELPWED